MTVKSESERIVVILTGDSNVHRFEFDDVVAKEHFLSQINGFTNAGPSKVLTEGNGSAPAQ